jgi:hypothetical protein
VLEESVVLEDEAGAAFVGALGGDVLVLEGARSSPVFTSSETSRKAGTARWPRVSNFLDMWLTATLMMNLGD